MVPQRILNWFQLDKAIVYSMASTLRGGLAGPLVAAAVATKFSPDVQGYYYAFSTIVGLQIFVELGLGTIIVQFAAHEWAHLARLPNGRIVGNPNAMSRLASIARFAVRWYAGGALVLSCGLVLVGWSFFGSAPHGDVDWQFPWVVLVLLAAIRFALSPLFSLLEGCGELASVYGYRLWEATQTVLVTIAAITLGANLWTAVFATVSALLASIVFITRWHGRFLIALVRTELSESISWQRELLPLQWRFALSWMAGYCAFQLFVPVTFRYQGPSTAGQVGLTLSLVGAVGAAGSAWIYTKVPTFGVLVAQQKWRELDSLAWRCGRAAVIISSVGTCAAVLLLLVLGSVRPDLSTRFLSYSDALPFLLASVILHITLVQATYLRAFKREPFLWPTVFGGALIGLSTWYLGSVYGPIGMGSGYLFVVALITFPVCTAIFLRLRSMWTTPEYKVRLGQ